MSTMGFSRRRLALLIICAVAGALASFRSQAVIGTIDAVPAATLLIPYFETSTTGDINAATTLVTVTNTNAAATVVNVVFWTDWGSPTLAVEAPLTGFDVLSFNVFDVFNNGRLPDGSTLSENDLTELTTKHTGEGILDGMTFRCFGRNFGDSTARGYITIDALNDPDAAAEFPGDAGYFAAGGTGKAGNANILWGEFIFVDTGNNFAQSFSAVHIEADGSDARTTNAGAYTFYGRYVGATAIDNREPLAYVWNVPYLTNGASSDGASIVYWRDSTVVNTNVVCGLNPPWFPLNQSELVFFDEDENAVDGGVSNIVPFIMESGRVRVGDGDLPIPFDAGWFYFDSRQTFGGSVLGGDRSQSYVLVIGDSEGRFSTGFQATAMTSAVTP